MREREVVLWLLALLVALFVATLVASGETSSPAGCVSSVRVGEEPVVVCDVLWLSVVHQPAQGGAE